MIWLALTVILLVLCFGSVLMFGAPYLPTLTLQQQKTFELLDLKKGQTLLELGSGDGRMLRAAAEKGIRAIGIELNPLLYLYSKTVLFRYRRLVSVKFGNFWAKKLPECDGIYVFLLDRYMPKLNKKITQEISGSVKVVSFAFEIPGKKHITEDSGLYLYVFNNKN